VKTWLLWWLPFLCISCADITLPEGRHFRTWGGDIAYTKGDESLVVQTSPAFIKAADVAGKFLDTLVTGYVMQNIASLMATTEQMTQAGLSKVEMQKLHNQAAATAGQQALDMEKLKLGAEAATPLL
jgi:hypothetical protein